MILQQCEFKKLILTVFSVFYVIGFYKRTEFQFEFMLHISIVIYTMTPLTNPAKVTDQGLCYCNSNSWGRLACIPKWKKARGVYRRNNNGPKTLPCGTPDTLTSVLGQPSTITCYGRFDRNCVNIDNSEPPIPTLQYPQSRA